MAIFDDDLEVTQIRNVERILNVKFWPKQFDTGYTSRARTAHAKTQVVWHNINITTQINKNVDSLSRQKGVLEWEVPEKHKLKQIEELSNKKSITKKN